MRQLLYLTVVVLAVVLLFESFHDPPATAIFGVTGSAMAIYIAVGLIRDWADRDCMARQIHLTLIG